MYFSTIVALAVLPFLVGTVPAQSFAHNLLSIPLSKRSTPSNADGYVDVESLQASIHYTIEKYGQGFNAFESNTGKPHPLASKPVHSNRRRDGTTVSLTNYRHNTIWYGNISVGTPAAPYTVDFDTGSAALFLPGPSCPNCDGHDIYNPTQSSTSKDLGTNSTLDYGRGEVTGEIYMDNVFAGGFKAVNQTLLTASNFTDNFNSTNFGADGIMGMGFKEISPFNATPFFETLVDQNQLEEPVFGFYLADSGSELIIGGRDCSRYSGNLTYVNVTKRGFWQTTFDAISVNGNDISISTMDAIIDTGNTLISGDQESISNIYSQIPGSAQSPDGSLWSIPCDTNVTVSMKFGGTTFDISPKTYNIGAVTNSTCVGGFSPTPTDTGFWVIGDVFLENVYTEFDYGNLRIGFAQLAQAP